MYLLVALLAVVVAAQANCSTGSSDDWAPTFYPGRTWTGLNPGRHLDGQACVQWPVMFSLISNPVVPFPLTATPKSIISNDLVTGANRSQTDDLGINSLSCSMRSHLVVEFTPTGLLRSLKFLSLPLPHYEVLASTADVVSALARDGGAYAVHGVGSSWNNAVALPHGLSDPSAVPDDGVIAYALSAGGQAVALFVVTTESRHLINGATAGIATLAFPINATCSSIELQRLAAGGMLLTCNATSLEASPVFSIVLQASAPAYSPNTTAYTAYSWPNMTRSVFVARVDVPSYVYALPGYPDRLSPRVVVSRFYANVSQQRVFIAVDSFSVIPPSNLLAWTRPQAIAVWHCMLPVGGGTIATRITCAFSDPVNFDAPQEVTVDKKPLYRTALGADLDLVILSDSAGITDLTAIRVIGFPSYGNWTPVLPYDANYTDPEPSGQATQRLNRNVVDYALRRTTSDITGEYVTMDLFETSGLDFIVSGYDLNKNYAWVPRAISVIPTHGLYPVRINGACASPGPYGYASAIVRLPTDDPSLLVSVDGVFYTGLALRIELADARTGEGLSYADSPNSTGAQVTLYTQGLPPGAYEINVRVVNSAGSSIVTQYPLVLSDPDGPILTPNVTTTPCTRAVASEILLRDAGGAVCAGVHPVPCAAILADTNASSLCASALNEYASVWCALTNNAFLACFVNGSVIKRAYNTTSCNSTAVVSVPGLMQTALSNTQRPLFLVVGGGDPYDMLLFAVETSYYAAKKFNLTITDPTTGDVYASTLRFSRVLQRVAVTTDAPGTAPRPIGLAIPTRATPRFMQELVPPSMFMVVLVRGGYIVTAFPMSSTWWPRLRVVRMPLSSEVPVALTGAALDGTVFFLAETRFSTVSIYRVGRVLPDGSLFFYERFVATGARDGSLLGRNVIVYGGGSSVVSISPRSASRVVGARVAQIHGCVSPRRVSADGMRLYCSNGTHVNLVRLSFNNTRRWNESLPAGSALAVAMPDEDTPPFYDWTTGQWFTNAPSIPYAGEPVMDHTTPASESSLSTNPDNVPWIAETRSYICSNPIRYASYPYRWHCHHAVGIYAGEVKPWERFPASVMIGYPGWIETLDVGIADGQADGPMIDIRAMGVPGRCDSSLYLRRLPYRYSPFCVYTGRAVTKMTYFVPPGMPRWRFPYMETAGLLPSQRIRMCRMEELRYACLLDERACLVVDSTVLEPSAPDTLPSDYDTVSTNSSVVAVSCDYDFWRALSLDVGSAANYSFWENAVATGQLTWLRPPLVRVSGSREAPVHEGNLPSLRVTVPLERDAVLNWTETCTADEGLCDNLAFSSTCNVTVYRSRVDGITLFRKVQRVCPEAVGGTVARVAKVALSTSAAQALCGPCWNALRDSVPRVLYTGENGTAIDPLSCGCSASCRSTTTDQRPCAVPDYPVCSKTPGSLFSAERLCGPLALDCLYTCSSSSTALAPVCSAVPGTCECTYPVADRSRCLPAPVTCTPAEMATQCGVYASACSVHRTTPPVYVCTGLLGAVKSPATGRFDTPIRPLSVAAAPVPFYSAANLTCLPWVDTASTSINLLRYFNCSWTDADVVGTGYACGPVADYASICATAGIDTAVRGAGMVILDSGSSFPAHDLPTRQVQSRVFSASTNLLPVSSSVVNLAAFLQLSHGFIPEGAVVGIPQNVPVSDALLATVNIPLQNYFYKAFPDDATPTVAEFRRAVPLKQNALAFRMRNVVPGGSYRALYEHFLGGNPVSAEGYRQWYNVSAFLASGKRMSPTAVTSQVVSITHEPVLGWTPAPEFRVNVPGVGAWATAPGETLDLNIVFSPLLPPEDDVLDCDRLTAPVHRSLGACRGATGVDPTAFRCVYAGVKPRQVLPVWSIVRSCGLEFSQAVRGRVVRTNGTDLLLVRQLSLEPLWSTSPAVSVLAAWRTPSVVARIDFSDRLSVRSDGTPVPLAYVEATRATSVVFTTQPDARRGGTVLRVDSSANGDSWLVLSTADASVSSAYTKTAWVSTGDASVDLATGFANIFSDTLPSVYGVALNEGLFVLRGRLHCGTMRAPKRLLSAPSETLLQSVSVAVNNTFFAEWRHLACTVNGTTAAGSANYTLYVDGVARATASVSAEWTSATATSMLGTLHYIGAYNDVSGARRVLGLIDNVGLYDRALSADSILAIYAGGDPDGDGSPVVAPVQGVCLDGECGNQTVVLSTRVFPIQLGFPLPIDDVGDRWAPLPDTFERPTFANELVAAYNWSMREAIQYVTTGAEFGVLGCLYQQFLLRADLNVSATCVGSTNGFPGALVGNYSGTASTLSEALALGISPSNVMLGVTRNSSGSFTRVFGTSWALDTDLAATSHPLLCTRASHAACGVTMEANPFARPSTGHARLRSATLRAPLATRITNVTNGVCFPIRVYGLDSRTPGGLGGSQEGLGIASGFVLISVQCTTSVTGARFVARAECVQGTPDNITVVDSARVSAVRGDTYLPRFALRHRVYASCTGTTCTGAVTWPNASTRLFTSLLSVDCGASTPLPSYTTTCNRTEVEASCGPSATACLKTCVYNELETFALSTYPFKCTVVPSSCACPNYDAYAVTQGQVPCASGGTLLCTAAEAAAFGCERSVSLCRKLCTATGCSAVPSTCFNNIGVPQSSPCTLAEADAACGPHFNVAPTAAEYADATVWHGLTPGSTVVTVDTVGWALSTDYNKISSVIRAAFARPNCTVLRRTEAVFSLPVYNYTFTCRAERMGVRPAAPNQQDVSMVRGGLCMYTAGPVVFRVNISTAATKFAGTSFEQAAAACDLDIACAGLFLNGTWIWPMTGLPANNTGNITGQYYGRSNCNRCVSTRTRTGRTTWTTASVNCSCPRATPGLITASTAQHTVGYVNASASKLACACQFNYGAATSATCPTACFPCTPAETDLFCSPATFSGGVVRGAAGNAGVPGAIQNASVCIRCPYNSIDTPRALSCPGTYTLRRCNASEVVNHCGSSAVSCVLACPPTQGFGFPQRCRLWGRCGFVRTCTPDESRRLCARYDPVTDRDPFLVRYGFYSGADNGASLSMPEGIEHAATAAAVSSCALREEQVDTGLLVTATRCNYSCPFFDTRYGICTEFDLSTAGTCSRELEMTTCGFPDQVTGCRVTAIGTVECNCTAGYGPTPNGRCRGALRTATSSDLDRWIGAFGSSATLACESGPPRDPATAALLPLPPIPSYHFDFDSPVFGDVRDQADGPITELRAGSADWGLVTNTTAASVQRFLRRGGNVLSIGAADAYTLSLPPLFAVTSFALSFWMRPTGSIVNRSAVLRTDTPGRAFAIRMVADTVPNTYVLSVSVGNGTILNVTEPSCAGCNRLDAWRHVTLSVDYAPSTGILTATLYSNGTTPTVSIPRRTGVTQPGDWGTQAHVRVRCLARTTVPDNAIVKIDGANVTATACRGLCLFEGATQMWHATTLCACGATSAAWSDPVAPACSGVGDDGVQTGLIANGTIALFDIHYLYALAGRILLGPQTSVALDDIRVYNRAVREDALVRSIYLADRFASESVVPSFESCTALNYTCQRNGFTDTVTGLPCGTNATRVLIDTTETGATVFGVRRPVSIRVLRHGVWEHIEQPAVITHATRHHVDLEGSVVISRGNATNESLAVLLSICGPNAVAAELDVPMTTGGALRFDLYVKYGVTCTCAEGFFSDTQALGYSPSDPIGTGPCAHRFRGTPCTPQESATLPWDALMRDCRGTFRCWKRCETNGTCAFLMDQPECTDRWIENATCSPLQAARLCPKGTISATLSSQIQWSCRGRCRYNGATLATQGATIQECTSAYACVGDAPDFSAVAPLDTSAQSGATLAYVVQTCAPAEFRDFCGTGAVGCTKRCAADGSFCYRFDTCTCQTNRVNGTNATVATFASPCDGTTTNMADAIRSCGPFVRSYDRVECSAPGVCAKVCDCQPGTGRFIGGVRDNTTYLPCSGFTRPCEGAADATERCSVARAKPNMAYASCSLRCAPAGTRNVAHPTELCNLDPDTCVESGPVRRTVTIIRAGGIRAEIDASLVVLPNLSNRACTCAREYACVETNPAVSADCINASVCRRLCVYNAPNTNRNFRELGTPCSTTSVITFGGRPGSTYPGLPVIATNEILGGGVIGDAVKSYLCATRCPTPSQRCEVRIRSRIDTCAYDPMEHVEVDPTSCVTDPPDRLAFCSASDLTQWAADPNNGGALRCKCTSPNCGGCGGPNMTNTSFCPVFPYTASGTVCEQYCPAGTTDCVLTRIPFPNLTELCGTLRGTATSPYFVSPVDSVPSGICGRAFMGSEYGPVCGPGFDFTALRNTYPDVYARVANSTLANNTLANGTRTNATLSFFFLADTPSFANLSTAQKSLLAAYYQVHMRTCNGNISASRASEARFKVQASCGRAGLLAEQPDLSTGVITVGSITYRLRVPCSRSQAAAFCGQAAVVDTDPVTGQPPCWSVNGVVDINTCRCDPTKRGVQPSFASDISRSPVNNEPCVAEGSERDCTSAEKDLYCGTGATVGCRMRAYAARSDNAVDFIGMTKGWLDSFSAEGRCDAYTVRPSALGIIGLARTLLDRLPLNVTAAPATMCIPRKGGFTDDLILNHLHPTADDAATQLLTAVVPNDELNMNWRYFGGIHTTRSVPGAPIYIVNLDNPAARPIILSQRTVINNQTIQATAQAECAANHYCGAWIIETPLGTQGTLSFLMRPVRILDAADLDVMWGSMPSATQPMRVWATCGWKMETDMALLSSGSIEGPILWHPVENWATRGNLDSLLPSGGAGRSVSDWIGLRQLGAESTAFNSGRDTEREVSPLLTNNTGRTLYPEVSGIETAVYGVRFHRLYDLCRASAACCGVSFLRASEFKATVQDSNQFYAPAIIGYPCKATRTTHTFHAYGDKFLPKIKATESFGNLPGQGRKELSDGAMYRYGAAFAAKRTFALKTRFLNDGVWKSADADSRLGKGGDLLIATTPTFFAASTNAGCLTEAPRPGQIAPNQNLYFASVDRRNFTANPFDWIAIPYCPGTGIPGVFLAEVTYTIRSDFNSSNPAGLATFYNQYLSGNMLRVSDNLTAALTELAQSPGAESGNGLGSSIRELVTDWYKKEHAGMPGPFAACANQDRMLKSDVLATSFGLPGLLARQSGPFHGFAWMPRCQCYAGVDHRNSDPTAWHGYDSIGSLSDSASQKATAFSPILARCDGRQIFNMASSGKSCPASDKGRVCSGVARCRTETSDFNTAQCTTAAATVRAAARAALDKIFDERAFYNHSTIPEISYHNKFRAWNLNGRPFIFHALEWIRRTMRDDTASSSSIYYRWRGTDVSDPLPRAMVALVDAALDFIREAPFAMNNVSTVPFNVRRFIRSGVYFTSDNMRCAPDPETTSFTGQVSDFERLFAMPSSLTNQSLSSARNTLQAAILNLSYATDSEAPSGGAPPSVTTLPWNAAYKSLYFTTNYGPGLDKNLEFTRHKCWNARAPIRFAFKDVFPVTYGANWNPLRDTIDVAAVEDRLRSLGNPSYWLHAHSIQMKTMPLHKWHLFYKNMVPGGAACDGMFVANEANTGIASGDMVGFSNSYMKNFVAALEAWDDPGTTPSEWFGAVGPGSSTGFASESETCRQARSSAFSTSVFAEGGARADDTRCEAFSCSCPRGRTGNACQYHALHRASDADRNWVNTRTTRTTTYGIAHFGTVCQSRNVEGVDRPNSTNCGDVDTSGRAGCINGVWNWDSAICVCDPGWSRPTDVSGELADGAFGNPSTWLLSAFYTAKFGQDMINPYYICIIPWVNASVPSCGSAPSGALCSENATACRPCNDRGVCLGTDGCRCRAGFYGRKCQYRVSEICDALPDTSGIALLPPPSNTSTPIQCSGHGSCEVRDISCACGQPDIIDPSCCNITALCTCVTTPGYGWSGVNCSQPYVIDPLGVSGGGCINGGVMRADAVVSPINTTATRGHRVWCECPREWTGTRCEISTCPRGPNGLVCSGHGICTFDNATKTSSCKSRYVILPNGGDPGRGKLYDYGPLNGTRMCVEPNGFDSENQPLRWNGEACEIDTYQFCASVVSGGNVTQLCGTSDIPNDFAANGTACREVRGKPGVYRCDCSVYKEKKTGPLCNVDACIKSGDSQRCSDRKAGVDSGGTCVCPCTPEDSDTPSRSLVGLAGPFLGQYCERDATRCRVGIARVDHEDVVVLYNATANSWSTRSGFAVPSPFGTMHMCTRPGLIDPTTGRQYRGECLGDGATARCVCKTNRQPCTDNTCESCLTTDTDAPTGAPTSLPTVAVPPGATGQPTGAPTRAPTALVIPELPFDAPTGNNSCGVSTPRLFCGSSRRALEPIRVQRSGALANTSTTFRATPAFETIGLRLNTTDGIVTGTPNRSGTFRFVVRATVGASASAATLDATTFESLVTLSVEAPCPVACGANSISCNTTTDAADGICVCRGMYFTNNSAAPCTAHPCLGAAFPDPQTATSCICADVRMSPLLGCNSSGCPSAPNGDTCGVTIKRTDLLVPGVDPAKECINSVCACSFPYTRNTSTGLCDALCDVDATRAVSNGACVCAADTEDRRDPATGCTKPLCYRGSAFNTASQTCSCAFPFNGTACSLASPATRCECADCGYGVASCDPGLYNATCSGGVAPNCICPTVVEGTRCQTPLCSRAHGSSIVSDGAGSWRCQCHASGVWGGRFCNESQCLNGGQPSWDTNAATWTCACPDGYDQTDLLCSGVCSSKAVKDPVTGACACTFPNGGRYCETNLCQFKPSEGRYTAGSTGFLPGATSCTCSSNWWVGKYCNISRCGALGAPIRCPGATNLVTPCGCSCIEGAAFEDQTQREKPGGFICQSINGCASGTYNPETGGCSCGLVDPHCRNAIQTAIVASTSAQPTATPTRAPTSSPASLPTAITAPPSAAPTTRTPTRAPTAGPTTRVPTSAPTTASPTTAPPSGGSIKPDVCPGSAIACGSGGGSNPPPTDTPTGSDVPADNTTPGTVPVTNEPPNQVSSGPRSSAINWAVVILPIIVAIVLTDHDE